MISALSWVPRAAVASVPRYFEPSEEELKRWKDEAETAGITNAASANIDSLLSRKDDDDEDDDDEVGGGGGEGHDDEDVDSEEEQKQKKKKSSKLKAKKAAAAMRDDDDEDLSRYNLDTYDDDSDVDLGASLLQGVGLTEFESNKEDPYMTVQDEEDDDEEEDVIIREHDTIILTTKHEDEVNSLEVNVYDTARGALYIHHDVMLPSFPLCISWLDLNPKNKAETGNFAAVGTMLPGIEIWDMDVLDAMEPIAALGGEDFEASKAAMKASKKKKKKSKKVKQILFPNSHSDAVLGLAWNTQHRNILASASADSTVKLWDISTLTCVHTMSHHKDKVQAIEWNPKTSSILLSGSFDKTVAVLDVRTPQNVEYRALPSDVECVAWNPYDESYFMVSTDKGSLLYYDTRKSKEPVFVIDAHNDSATGLSFNHCIPGCIASSSLERSVKIWDISSGAPRLVCSKEPQIGRVFTVQWCAELPFVLAAGGSQGRLCVWDTAENKQMREVFSSRVPSVCLDEYESAADGAAAAVQSMTLSEPTLLPHEPSKDKKDRKKKK